MSTTSLVTTPSRQLYQQQSGSSQSIIPSQPTSAVSPYKATVAPTPALTPSPGTFRHPRLDEIISRQKKTTFSESNIRSAIINGAAIILTLVFSSNIQSTVSTLINLTGLPPSATAEATSTVLALLRILFLINIILSLRPIIPYISQKDTISDIPLTPSQRSLLGLPPSASPSTTSTSTFTTPPRYRRRLSVPSSSFSPSDTTTPTTDHRSISADYSSSPRSTSRSTLGFSPTSPASQTQPRRIASGSPFSPNASQQSPLFHKAIDRRVARRDSGDLLDNGFGRSSFGTNGRPLGRSIGLRRSQSVKERGRDAFGETGNGSGRSSAATAAAGSPAVGKRGVNYKWLYDKGVGLSRSRGSNSGTGIGSGSGGLVKSESMAF